MGTSTSKTENYHTYGQKKVHTQQAVAHRVGRVFSPSATEPFSEASIKENPLEGIKLSSHKATLPLTLEGGDSADFSELNRIRKVLTLPQDTEPAFSELTPLSGGNDPALALLDSVRETEKELAFAETSAPSPLIMPGLDFLQDGGAKRGRPPKDKKKKEKKEKEVEKEEIEEESPVSPPSPVSPDSPDEEEPVEQPSISSPPEEDEEVSEEIEKILEEDEDTSPVEDVADDDIPAVAEEGLEASEPSLGFSPTSSFHQSRYQETSFSETSSANPEATFHSEESASDYNFMLDQDNQIKQPFD